MSNLVPTTAAELCVSEPAAPTVEALPGRLTDLGGLPIRRLLPRSRRRLVGPLVLPRLLRSADLHLGKAMDVAPHPHIGLQTVSWLLEGEMRPPRQPRPRGAGRSRRAQPDDGAGGASRTRRRRPREQRAPAGPAALGGAAGGHSARPPRPSTSIATLPVVELDGGRATLIMGELAGRALTGPRLLADRGRRRVSGEPGRRLVLPLEPEFEHALVLLEGGCRLDGQPLSIDTLYYLGCGRGELVLLAEGAGVRACCCSAARPSARRS